MDEDKQIKIMLMIFEAINNKLTYLRGTLVLAGKLEQVVQVPHNAPALSHTTRTDEADNGPCYMAS